MGRIIGRSSPLSGVYDGIMKSILPATDGPKPANMLYCNLFSDVVTESLYLMRRRQVGSKGVFFCEVCDQMEGRTLVHEGH